MSSLRIAIQCGFVSMNGAAPKNPPCTYGTLRISPCEKGIWSWPTLSIAKFGRVLLSMTAPGTNDPSPLLPSSSRLAAEPTVSSSPRLALSALAAGSIDEPPGAVRCLRCLFLVTLAGGLASILIRSWALSADSFLSRSPSSTSEPLEPARRICSTRFLCLRSNILCALSSFLLTRLLRYLSRRLAYESCIRLKRRFPSTIRWACASATSRDDARRWASKFDSSAPSRGWRSQTLRRRRIVRKVDTADASDMHVRRRLNVVCGMPHGLLSPPLWHPSSDAQEPALSAWCPPQGTSLSTTKVMIQNVMR
mmetsp:Transcript_26181/g.62211  ORF Transcript_26181/g.62211 Transcript_26181/m.62211 type:complete len:308 (-) Transcript_26181:397-1320(-)